MEEQKEDSKNVKKHTELNSFPIVGVGASPNGLAALAGLFSNLPSDANMAFVIIQHVTPDRKSMKRSLLQQYTTMKVLEVEDWMPVEPHCIYLNPPHKNMVIINRRFHLLVSIKKDGINLPIDQFLRSLSEDIAEKAICILLSGTGIDGALGLKAIKGVGGMTMIQEEKQTKEAGMPASGIDLGLVDYILPVEQMPTELIKYVQHPYIEAPERLEHAEEQFEHGLRKIFVLIRSRLGHDFSEYRQTTIRRRIERRMAIHRIDHIMMYLNYLQKTPNEVEYLFNDLLIGVTNFFRDAEAFETLKAKVLSSLIKTRQPDVPLRIWIAGCSTGEEAYSMAILLAEAMEKLSKPCDVKLFASDVDADAIQYARRAVYPGNIAADISPERLQRFFIKKENRYKVKEQIRAMVVFTRHNLLKDPPFSKLDLISCRNLLIYIDNQGLEKVFSLFHASLNPEGFLFLGSSESVGEFTNLFAALDFKAKIYQRRETTPAKTIELSMAAFFKAYPALRKVEEKRLHLQPNVQALAEKIVLDDYAPPAVVIDKDSQILYFIGQTDKFLRHPTGDPGFDLFTMARQGLRQKLRTAIRTAAAHHKTVVSVGARVRQNGNFRNVDIVVRPLTDPPFPRNTMMVVFYERPFSEGDVQKKKAAQDKEVAPQIANLAQELYTTKEDLQATIEELDAANEELKSMNEALQSVNEALQTSNEELQTFKTDLQSANEELSAVNVELQSKLEELSRANNDIDNLLASTEISAIFLDTNLGIKRFTPTMKRFFHLIPSDLNRPLSDITSNLDYDHLYDDVRTVLYSQARKESEIRTKEGTWYTMRIAPYHTSEHVIDGVVITFVDITALKKARETLLESEAKLKVFIKKGVQGS